MQMVTLDLCIPSIVPLSFHICSIRAIISMKATSWIVSSVCQHQSMKGPTFNAIILMKTSCQSWIELLTQTLRKAVTQQGQHKSLPGTVWCNTWLRFEPMTLSYTYWNSHPHYIASIVQNFCEICQKIQYYSHHYQQYALHHSKQSGSLKQS